MKLIDLVDFVVWLQSQGFDIGKVSREKLGKLAEEWWETQHGDEHG